MSIEKITLVSSDMVDSTGLKNRHPVDDVNETIKRSREYMKSCVKSWSGEVWNIAGDGLEFFFRTDGSELRAFSCAYSILNYLPVFNLCQSAIDEELKFRFSIGTLHVEDLDEKNYGEISSPDIDEICKAQKNIAKENQVVILESAYKNIPKRIRDSCSEILQEREKFYVFSPFTKKEIKFFEEDMLKLKKVTYYKFRPAKDVLLNIAISDNLTFLNLTKLSYYKQDFILYYSFITNEDKDKERWIGYRNKYPYNNIAENEHTMGIDFPNSTHIIIIENILETIKKRFPNLKGIPSEIVKVRFRGSDEIQLPIDFYYDFYDSK
jgi:hypothetical protein